MATSRVLVEITRNGLYLPRAYQVDAQHRGEALIICNHKFSDDGTDSSNDLPGYLKDEEKLVKLFREELNFTVFSKRNVGVVGFESALKDFCHGTLKDGDSKQNEASSIFVLVIMTHGNEYSVDMTDGQVDKIEIMQQLCRNYAVMWDGKPKLVIFQACSGEHSDLIQNQSQAISPGKTTVVEQPRESFNYEMQKRRPDGTNAHNMSDIVVAYAAPPSFKAYVSDDKGSLFIDFICNVFRLYWQKMHVVDMLTIVRRLYEKDGLIPVTEDGDMGPQMSPTHDLLRHQFYFSSGLERRCANMDNGLGVSVIITRREKLERMNNDTMEMKFMQLLKARGEDSIYSSGAGHITNGVYYFYSQFITAFVVDTEPKQVTSIFLEDPFNVKKITENDLSTIPLDEQRFGRSVGSTCSFADDRGICYIAAQTSKGAIVFKRTKQSTIIDRFIEMPVKQEMSHGCILYIAPRKSLMCLVDFNVIFEVSLEKKLDKSHLAHAGYCFKNTKINDISYSSQVNCFAITFANKMALITDGNFNCEQPIMKEDWSPGLCLVNWNSFVIIADEKKLNYVYIFRPDGQLLKEIEIKDVDIQFTAWSTPELACADGLTLYLWLPIKNAGNQSFVRLIKPVKIPCDFDMTQRENKLFGIDPNTKPTVRLWTADELKVADSRIAALPNFNLLGAK